MTVPFDRAAQVPALRTLGNIVTGDDRSTQAVIDAGVIPVLMALFTSDKVRSKRPKLYFVSHLRAVVNRPCCWV